MTATQRAALEAIEPHKKTQEETILTLLTAIGPTTRQDVSEILTMPLASVCRAVCALMKRKKVVVYVSRPVRNEKSGKNRETIGVVSSTSSTIPDHAKNTLG